MATFLSLHPMVLPLIGVVVYAVSLWLGVLARGSRPEGSRQDAPDSFMDTQYWGGLGRPGS